MKLAKTAVARERLWQARPFLGNGSAAIEGLLEVLFSVWSMPRVYNEDQLPLREHSVMVVRRVGGWCVMAASLQGREPQGRGTSAVQRHYQAA
jgi:hypothetical protein